MGHLYQIGRGVLLEEHFFGFARELDWVRKHGTSNALLIGGRMQGKSSLLEAVKRRSRGWGWRSFYLHARIDLLGKIAQSIDRDQSIPRDDPRRELLDDDTNPRAVAEYLRACYPDTPIVFLIDEAQSLVEPASSQANFELLEEIQEELSDQGCGFVLAGGWPLLRASQTHPFDNFGRLLTLKPLDVAASRELVLSLEQRELRFASQRLVQRILRETGRQAYLLCLVCDQIEQQFPQAGSIEVASGEVLDAQIEAHHVDRALSSSAVRDKLIGWRDKLRRSEWPWAVDLLEESIDEGVLEQSRFLERLGDKIERPTDLEDCLRHLRLNGWLLPRRRHQQYEHLPLLRAEMQRNQPAPSEAAEAAGTGTPETKPILSQPPFVDTRPMPLVRGPRFQVALSFPGEERPFVEPIADILGEHLGWDKVFYDKNFEFELARPNLDTYLQDLYHKQSMLLVVFLCKSYKDKLWPGGVEWRAIRDLIGQRQDEAIMPVRHDDTDIPGIFSIDGYIDAREKTPEDVAYLIFQRVQLMNQNLRS